MRKFIKTYEEFSKEKLIKLKDEHESYINKKLSDIKIYDDVEYEKTFLLLKNYDFSKFKYEQTPYSISIYPDITYMYLYKKLSEITKQKFIENYYFSYSLTTDINLIDVANDLPLILRGTSAAFKCYKLIIKKNKFISSASNTSLDAYNLWYHLLQNEEFYAITSKTKSVLIDKKVSDDDLKKILDKFRGLIYDDFLQIKIKELYGDLYI